MAKAKTVDTKEAVETVSEQRIMLNTVSVSLFGATNALRQGEKEQAARDLQNALMEMAGVKRKIDKLYNALYREINQS